MSEDFIRYLEFTGVRDRSFSPARVFADATPFWFVNRLTGIRRLNDRGRHDTTRLAAARPAKVTK